MTRIVERTMTTMPSDYQDAGDAYAEEPGRSLAEYLAIVRRHRRLMLAVAGSLFVVAVLVAMLIPPVYRSSATILIEEQEIPQDLVRSTVTSYADERIQVISQQVMTRAVLMQLVNKYDLYANTRQRDTNEELLDRMRRDIKLTPIISDTTDRRSGSQIKATIAFMLSYENSSPEKAQKIANELVTLYLNENLKNRQEKAAEASTFLTEESERLASHIAQVEQKLADFKRRNRGKLPELAVLNQQISERTDGELLRIDHEITTVEDRKIFLAAQLTQVKPNNPIVSSDQQRTVLEPDERLRSLQAQLASIAGLYTEDHPDVKRMRREIASLEKQAGTSDDLVERQARRAELDARLKELQQKYADEHPDVVKLKRAIAALDATAADTTKREPGAAKKKPDNPAFITLQTQIESANLELQSLRAQRLDLQAKLDGLETRMQQAPEVEREYFDLSRDQENSVQRYRELKAKLMQAEVAEKLELGRKAERFSLIEPPQYPERPVRPNRPAIMLGGLVLALVGGLASAGIAEALDDKIRSAKDVVRVMRVPVLSVIPSLVEVVRPGARKRRSMRLWLMGAGALLAVVVVLVLVDQLFMPLEVLWYAVLRRLPF
jgi:uncharacterized protein involved in exopolysaccharide biosynthesis